MVMTQTSIAMAKLAGIRNALLSAKNENVSRNRSAGEALTRSSFSLDLVKHYFDQAASLLDTLKNSLPDLYKDFQEIKTQPDTAMADANASMHFSKAQIDSLIRDIDQIFEIRANSELQQPHQNAIRKVFISHGNSNDWRKVQPHIEKDIGLATLELAQEENLGQTILEKLIDNSAYCDSAVIVTTGDDIAQEAEARVRENVMHEIGFFQGRYGRNLVILLHEEGVNIPSNLHGLVYIPYPKNNIEAGFHVLTRELKAIYKI